MSSFSPTSPPPPPTAGGGGLPHHHPIPSTHAKPPKMIYRKLGNTGLDVSLFSYGSWATVDFTLGVPETAEIMKTCYDAGVNFFDTAEVYSHGRAEEIMGEALKQLSLPRENIVLSTKIYFGSSKDPKPTARGLSRKHIIEGVRGSLRRLQVDYVDIVFAHRMDVETPVEETVRAFNWVIEQGWAFYYGTSEWSPAQILKAHEVAARLNLIPPCAEQPQYNLLHRRRVEIEYQQLYDQLGIGLTTFSPLACGLLTGKYSSSGGGDGGNMNISLLPPTSRFSLERYKFLGERWLVEEKMAKAEALRGVAEELGVTSAQLALAWCASNPRVSSVLTGATRVEQVHENLRALDVMSLLANPDVMARIDEVMGGSSELCLGQQ